VQISHDNLTLKSKNNASSQLTDYNFNSYCQFRENFLACNQSGVDKIGGTGGVASMFETFVTNLNWPGKKRNRYIYVGIETEGTIIITPIIDGTDGTPITFTPNSAGRQYMRMTVSKDNVGYYWAYRVENVDGCWFAISEVSILPTYLSKRRS